MKKLFLSLMTVLLAAAFCGCGRSTHPTLPPLLTGAEEPVSDSPASRTDTERTADAGTTEAEENTAASGQDASEPEQTASLPPETEQAAVIPEDPDNIIDLGTTLYTYDKMAADLAYLASCYPRYMTLETAGTTADGRSVFAVYFGNREAPRQIFLCAATHAREYMTAQLVMKQLEYYCGHYETGSYNEIPYRTIFENTCFVIVPMVNPDGVTISQLGEEGLNRQDLRDNLRNIFASDLTGGFTDQTDYASYLVRWKANGVGVDINRNFSPGWETLADRPVPSSSLYKGAAPGSELETQALMNLVNGLSNPLLAVSYHSYGDLIYWQYGQPEPLWTANANLATHISNLTGHSPAGYSNEAGFSNWCVLEKQIPSVTVETGTVPAPLPLEQFADLWNRHQNMWAMLATVY